ncbi:TonB-dependent receptor domain-containing protein [Paraglaciecola sp. MB-3u-78]|uniref:TonB-dependent receptor domain-containing protein n=1 Tax=Paraglaciecola sp. MB-3u-78 TaxID=2058332 RepID=UPI000C325622|nr:TonB-dependent receptor [Paraglaciecola sp. MB-3u-78]PKH00110.1 ligand-gated channel [Paraglaciecola sp. MB-3u-78]
MSFNLSKISLFVLAVIASRPVLSEDKPTQKDENDIEKLIITASPLGRSVLQSSTPVSILSGEELEKNQSATLGETLKSVPGVNSTYFGPVSSSPIIRGLDGPRVKVIQNGLDSSDASRVGPDHVTTNETSTATQIEVLRGPSTLLYGSGAIGGVVNVVDNRLPKTRQDTTSGRVSALNDSVSNERSVSTDLNGGSGKVAWHLDAFKRKTDDYDVPEFALEDGDIVDTIDNSDIDSQGFTFGAGWIGDDVTVALSYGRLETDYGIPGHAHEDHEEHDEEEGHDEEVIEEAAVFARMKQDRVQSTVDWKNLSGLFTEVHWHSAYTDYQHSEIEEGVVGTTFANDSLESRLWAKHKAVLGWEGVVGLHYTNSEFSAFGEEAFTPSTDSTNAALFVLEEKSIGDFLWQLGGRIEDVSHKPDNDFFIDNEVDADFKNLTYTAASASAGFVYQVNDNQSIALNYAFSERAPSSSEIFSNGLHISTSTYEVGAGFDLVIDDSDPDDIEFAVVQSSHEVDKEISNNLDITYRIQADNLQMNFSVFYNQIDNYLFQQNTGLEFHDHEAEEVHAAEEEEGTPVYLFTQQDAELYGFEVDVDWHLNEYLRVSAFTDFTRARLAHSDDNNTNLPRIPPMRLGAELHWEQDNWHAELGATHYSKQDEIADYETQTDGYTLVSASFNYYVPLGDNDLTLYVKGNNLTNELAKVHSSFIKDVAPLPARSFVVGAKYNF